MSGDDNNNQDQGEILFETYTWETDEDWQILVRSLEFPAHFSPAQKEKFILKRKQKYFKQNIDQDFVIKQPSAARSTESKHTYTSAEPKPDTNRQSSNGDTPNSEDTNNTSPSGSSNNNSNSNSNSTSNSTSTSSSSQSQSQSRPRQQQSYARHPYGQYRPPATKFGTMIAPLLNYFYLIAQWFIFLNAMCSIIYPQCYSYALLAVAITHVTATLQNCGRPRFEGWYAQLIMREENTLIAVYGFILLMGARHLIFLSPIILRSFFMASYLTHGFTASKLPASLYSRISPVLQKVIAQQMWFNRNVAMSEVFVGIFLIFACFFMSRTVVMTLIYWQVMQARYMMSGYIKLAFTNIHSKISAVLSSVPFLLNLYMKLANFLAGMVDPAQMQQRMQSGGAGGGGISGMAKKFCTIM